MSDNDLLGTLRIMVDSGEMTDQEVTELLNKITVKKIGGINVKAV